MKKLFFIALCLATFNLEATHFQSSMNVNPMNNSGEYLVEMQVEKMTDAESAPQLIAAPKIICREGERAEMIIEPEGTGNFLSFQVLASKNPSQTAVQGSVLIKEGGQVVFSHDHVTNVNR